MQQLCWNPSRRQAEVLDLPAPLAGPGFVGVRNAFSVISAGTERSNTQLSLAHPVKLMRSRPDLVRKVQQMARSRGLRQTWQAVQSRLGGLQPVGYSCAGVVEAVGDGSGPFEIGERVACAGGGYAVHAGQVVVPYNLCARVPAGCDMEAAGLGTLGAIALHGFRLSRATVGDRVLVIGLGLIGQLAARIALAAGCSVAGLDPDEYRGGLLAAQGAGPIWTPASAPAEAEFDAVLIAAASSGSDLPALAARLARSRARVVAVGLFPLELPRDEYYHKELEFVVSRSTGPGRYDPAYEELGVDYPLEYVRWTEQRNLGAYLELVAAGRLRVADLITHRFPIADGVQAYNQMLAPAPRQMGLLLTYPGAECAPVASCALPRAAQRAAGPGRPRVAVIGAGRFAQAVLLPALARLEVERTAICTRRPLEGRGAGTRFGFGRLVSDPALIFQDAESDAVIIATRHDSHAELVRQGLAAGKAVFVEKPLALTAAQLEQVAAALGPQSSLMVGFNRRFAPLAGAIRAHFAGNEAKLVVHYRVNAGRIPAHDWTQVTEIGGGRIVGEACHFVDLISYLTDSLPATVYAAGNRHAATGDEAVITLGMENGAVGVITYVASGSPAMEKERVEIFGAGKSAVICDWQWAEMASGGRSRKLRKPGKGHAEEMDAWIASLRQGTAAPIAAASLLRTSSATFAVAQSLREGRGITLTGALGAAAPA